ncbi:thromboxane-A synthase-like [Sarcoptes scabiei]|nr:thromboxane-A synthase-like [Sarcoptes scabiei]
MATKTTTNILANNRASNETIKKCDRFMKFPDENDDYNEVHSYCSQSKLHNYSKKILRQQTKKKHAESFMKFENENCDDVVDEDGRKIGNENLHRHYSDSLSEYNKDLIQIFYGNSNHHHQIQQQEHRDETNDNRTQSLTIDYDQEWNEFQSSSACLAPQNNEEHSSYGDDGLAQIIGTDSNQIITLESESTKKNTNQLDSGKSQPIDSFFHTEQDEDHFEELGHQSQTDFDATSYASESNFLYGRLEQMEHEQELLNNSLVALTTHFAQVQLRLRQIIEAKDIDHERRERLLTELETFANRGIPDLMVSVSNDQFPSGLHRSVSMATSLMADDVFDDDIDNDGVDDEDENNQCSNQDNSLNDAKIDERCRGENDQRNFSDNFRSKISSSNQNSRKLSSNSSLSHHIDADTLASYRNQNSITMDSISSRMKKNSMRLITEDHLERQRSRQKELIEQLKEQLEDLERYAYETGESSSLPSSMLLERQNVIIEQLKSKLPILSIDEIDRLEPDELRQKVDQAIKELVNPVLMKEHLVAQLKTQVTDLERFIYFLQKNGHHKFSKIQQKLDEKRQKNRTTSMFDVIRMLRKKSPSNTFETASRQPSSASSSTKIVGQCIDEEMRNNVQELNPNRDMQCSSSPSPSSSSLRRGTTTTTELSKSSKHREPKAENLYSANDNSQHQHSISLFKRILSLLYIFAWTELGSSTSSSSSSPSSSSSSSSSANGHELCRNNSLINGFVRKQPKPERFVLNQSHSVRPLQLSTTTQCKHWGNLRARLEISITSLMEFFDRHNRNRNSSHNKPYQDDYHQNHHHRSASHSLLKKEQNKCDGYDDGDEKKIFDQNDEDDDEGENETDEIDSNEIEDCISLGSTTLVTDNYFVYEHVTNLVRKEFSIALRNLIEHGLIGSDGFLSNSLRSMINSGSQSMTVSNSSQMIQSNRFETIWNNGDWNNFSFRSNESNHLAVNNLFDSLRSIGFGCFSQRSSKLLKPRPMHAWDLIIYYYQLKNGSKFRSIHSRRLSQSFGLQISSGFRSNPKHSLLIAIDDIIDSHSRLKRSLDSHFKAFISMGLNQQMLGEWLRLILRNPTIVNDCYEKWSYTSSTGFEDALKQLDKLAKYRFCLPTDLAIRQLQSIHDAF